MVPHGLVFVGHRMRSARQMLINGQFIWQVTFKPTNLLTEDPSTEVIGAGGEIFVNVDLKTEKTDLRYGE